MTLNEWVVAREELERLAARISSELRSIDAQPHDTVEIILTKRDQDLVDLALKPKYRVS